MQGSSPSAQTEVSLHWGEQLNEAAQLDAQILVTPTSIDVSNSCNVCPSTSERTKSLGSVTAGPAATRTKPLSLQHM